MLAQKIGVDLGTANILVCLPRRGVVINEPSVVALNLDNDELVAIGSEAEQMLGRTPEALASYHPLRDGVIADFQVTEAMIKHYINTAAGQFRLIKPDVMLSVPAGATSTERKAVIDAAEAAGAREAFLIQEPVAAALGADVPITSPAGNLVIDIGGGTTEIAVISLGGIVAQNSIRVGGNKIDAAIADYLRRSHGLFVGERTAEAIKQKIGNPILLDKPLIMEVGGRDIAGGLPKTIRLTSSEIAPVIQDVADKIVLAIRQVIEATPPELVSDIIDRGIVLTGGGALLKGLDELLAKEIDVPVIVAKKPLLNVAQGILVALDNLDEYKKSLLNST